MLVNTAIAHNTETIQEIGTEGQQVPPVVEANPPVDVGGQQQQVVTEQVPNLQELDFKSTFLDWATESGFTITPESVPDIKDESEMKQLVSKTYAVEYAKSIDPMMSELLANGISFNDFQSEIQPLKEIVSQSPEDLYTYEKYVEEIKELETLGKLTDKSTEEDYRAIWDEIKKSTANKMSSFSDNEKEKLVANARNKYQAQLDDSLNGWQSKKQQQVVERQKAYEESYSQELNSLLGMVDGLYKENKLNGLFGQPEQETFKKYLQDQLSITDMTIKKNGKDEQVRGIPFMHKLNTDDSYLLKVMSVMHQYESGKVADVVNSSVNKVVGGLRLTPLSKGSTTAAPQGVSKFVDTSKPHKRV